MKNIAEELVKTIVMMIDKKLENYKVDRTYKAVVKGVDKKGYIINVSGRERIVKCCIPKIELRPGQQVWVKEPMGDYNELHICGVMSK